MSVTCLVEERYTLHNYQLDNENFCFCSLIVINRFFAIFQYCKF
jgi:hypothetical protein